jgi:hypothetical protein
MTSQEFEILLQSEGSQHVYGHCLFDNHVHIFKKAFPGDAEGTYHRFKVRVSELLDVQLQNVAIVGSAKMGFSLSPGKAYKPFHNESDLDLVIVSPELFREIWKNYFDYVNSSTGKQYAAVAKNIFRHFVSIKAEDVTGDQLKYFEGWITKVDKLRLALQLNFALPLEINYRVYEDWSYVKSYHLSGLNQLESKQ